MKKAFKRIAAMALVLAMILSLIPAVSAAGTLTASDANIGLSWTDASSSSGSASWSISSDDTITGTAKGYKVMSILSRTVTTTLTITNNYTDARTLSFSYTLSGGGSVAISVGSMADGKYSNEIAAGSTAVITLTSPSGTSTNTLTISGIQLIGSSEVTSTFNPATNGSYTVNGTAITEATSFSQAANIAYTLAATPASGYVFFGWWSESQSKYVSYEQSASLTFAADPQLTAKFIANTVALFSVGNEKFDDLTAACTYASSAATKTIVLLNNGVVSGSHTIPAGVTLLVPYNSANTLITSKASSIGYTGTQLVSAVNNQWETPYAYRTLTLAENAAITVNGAISVGGRHSQAVGHFNYVQPGGGPSGPCGFINMGAGSNITVNSDAALYAWGYVVGSGSVMVKDGGSVYENFQFMGFRGGTATSAMATDGRVFPFNQYYVQNVEVATTYETGASEYVATSVFMQKSEGTATVKFIGEDGMFIPTSGSFTKKYDGSTDRLILTVEGDIALNSLSMAMQVGLTKIDIDSSKYALPITSNISINLISGTTTINQDVELLPGVEVTVGKDATLALSTGTTESNVFAGRFNVIAYDADEWTYGIDSTGAIVEGLNYTRSKDNRRLAPIPYAYARTYDRQESDLKDVIVDINGTLVTDGYLYTTAGGASIISSEGTGKFVMNNGSGIDEYTQQALNDADNNPAYYSIPIYPAWLKNADGSYTKTEGSSALSVFSYADGAWRRTSGECTHNYNAVVTAPTCTVNGYTTYTCTLCGDSYIADPVTAAHTYTSTTVDASCTADGAITYTCSVCGDTYSETIAAIGHDYNADVIAPTCDVAGCTIYTCANCGDSYIVDGEEALGHSYDAVVTAPTCTEKGYTTYTCTNCGENYIADETEPRGHSYDEGTVTTEPTCAAEGVKTYTCTVCGDIKTEAIAALDHNYNAVVTAPTCEAAGYTTYTCSVCGDSYIADETAALGHSYDEGTVTTEPTCTAEGVKTYTCTTCGDIKTEAIAALDHNYNAVVTAPTCEAAGYTTYTCSACGDTYTADETAALGHSYDEGTVTTEPTCTAEGVKTYTCTICGDIKTEAIAALGHTEVIDEAVAPTCTETGLTEGSHCSVCGETIVAQQEIAALGHSYDAVVTAPTCEAAGYTTYTCTVCGDTYTADETAALDHNFDVVTTEPTCTQAGYQTFTCMNCGFSYVDGYVDALPHTTIDTVKEATEEEHGYHRIECIDCGAILFETIEHSYAMIIGVEPTCTTEGEGWINCRVCGYSPQLDPEIIPALGHSYESVITDPTCDAAGYTTYTCTVCGDTYTADETTALGHSYDEGVVTSEPTCTEAGVKTYTCANCGDAYTEEIEALGHSYDAVVTAPTCEAAGYTTYTCTVCGDTYTADETEALGHSYDEGTVTTEPTCTEAGVKTFTCANCGDAYTEEIEALGHSYDAVVTAPTCEAAGYTTYTCTVCGDTYTADETAALGHNYSYTNNGDNHTATCANCSDSVTEDHTYVDGTCACGATEVVAPKPDANLVFTMNISAGAEMTVTYNIMGVAVNSYADFYLEVKKDVAGGDPITTVYGISGDREPMVAKVNPSTGVAMMYQVTYKGINAKEMGDNFSTTLYAVAEDGTVYCGATSVKSIKSYLLEKADAEASIPELKTMAIDMLKYGAAAQVRLGYNTENLVTADLTEEQLSYATQEIPEAVNYAATSGTGAAVNTNITVTSRVQLNLSCIYTTATDPNAVKCVITDSEGKVLAEIAATNKAGIMFSAIYEDVGAKQMRDVINATFYEGETAISQTVSWSVESYVAQVRAKTNVAEDELNMV
ncbi:MAG: hypothetical protein E7434_05980, partial [Ruminococcaceae bacterium]|nr:hypothetical protein [Oscillospiraceae bacterium]